VKLQVALPSSRQSWLGPPPPPQHRGFDGDLQRLFVISGLLHYHLSRQNLLIDGDSVLFADDHVLAFGRFSLFRSDQYLGVLQINFVDQKRILIHLHLLMTQSFIIDDRLDLSMKNITIISTARKIVVPPAISFSF
jgi:hypothetical protein